MGVGSLTQELLDAVRELPENVFKKSNCQNLDEEITFYKTIDNNKTVLIYPKEEKIERICTQPEAKNIIMLHPTKLQFKYKKHSYSLSPNHKS